MLTLFLDEILFDFGFVFLNRLGVVWMIEENHKWQSFFGQLFSVFKRNFSADVNGNYYFYMANSVHRFKTNLTSGMHFSCAQIFNSSP